MTHYDYQENLEKLWKTGVERYKSGRRTVENIVVDEEEIFLTSIGLNVIDLFDYVEDFVLEGEPTWNTFAAICEVRRSYFLQCQEGTPSIHVVKMDELPPKDEEAKASDGYQESYLKQLELRGELEPSIMYNCGVTETFRSSNIHPAEFLRVAWSYESSQKIIDWVVNRISNNCNSSKPIDLCTRLHEVELKKRRWVRD